MTDTPDPRTLAAEALAQAGIDVVWSAEEVADAVLAAVLPEHRRQVLAEAADRLDPGPRDHGRAEAEMTSADWVKAAQRGAAVNLRMWAWQEPAAAAPETAPRPRQNDETAPAVGQEAAQAQGPAEGAAPDGLSWSEAARLVAADARCIEAKRIALAAPDGPRTWQLPDEPGPEVTAVRTEGGHIWEREDNGWRYRTSGHVLGVVGAWRRWDGLVITEGPLTDATTADGQDGDGHG